MLQLDAILSQPKPQGIDNGHQIVELWFAAAPPWEIYSNSWIQKSVPTPLLFNPEYPRIGCEYCLHASAGRSLAKPTISDHAQRTWVGFYIGLKNLCSPQAHIKTWFVQSSREIDAEQIKQPI